MVDTVLFVLAGAAAVLVTQMILDSYVSAAITAGNTDSAQTYATWGAVLNAVGLLIVIIGFYYNWNK